jgi:threonylcarbamoyladenosine tRNA methylthiotransferase MtaB
MRRRGIWNKKNTNILFELVQELDKVEGIERLRISSIEPNLLKNETIEFVSKSRTLPHSYPTPVKVKILKLMKRRYQREIYTERVN